MDNDGKSRDHFHDGGGGKKGTRKFPRNFVRTPGHMTVLNPGDFQNIHRNCRDIMPLWLEGVQLNVRKKCTPNTIGLFSWILSHTNPTGCRVGGIHAPAIEPNLVVSTRINMQTVRIVMFLYAT